MKMLIVAFLLTSASAFASDAIDPYQVCTSIPSTFWQTACIRDVSAAKTFDQNALAVCDSILKDSHTAVDIHSCMSKIANGRYDKNATVVCGKITDNDYIVTCLKNIKNKAYAPVAVDACDNETFDSYYTTQCLSSLTPTRSL